MPSWLGAMNHEVVKRKRSWALINAQIKRVLDFDKGWDKTFWKDANWTVVFVCPFDVTGDSGDGRISMDVETRYGSRSADGKIWSFNAREGIEFNKREEYFRIAIDTPQDLISWEVGKRQATCEVGILPQEHFELAKCLSENYAENLTNFLKTSAEKYST